MSRIVVAVSDIVGIAVVVNVAITTMIVAVVLAKVTSNAVAVSIVLLLFRVHTAW